MSSKLLKDATQEELLAELIERSGGLSQAPDTIRYCSTMREALVGIGYDETASIFLDQESYEALVDIVGADK
ncbi:hypothetical protein [uncultured Kiloniella sp.]|uniref:hypothetical protein n=1 Tax=uncultured Kiloniella sp. TaxID=1133091 RepID=UPI002637A83B|nr:hypothetical protein [uncultured Kiloniella sp.]